MRPPPTYTSWKITCHSSEEARALQQWLTNRIDLDRVLTDTVRVMPDGVEQVQTVRHRLGDYFAAIRLLPDSQSNPASFRLVFHKRPDAGRFWKDLMVNILQEIEATPQKPAIELDSKRDWKPSDGIAGDSPYRNISSESLQGCSLLAEKIPSLAPMPQRWLNPDHVLWKIGDWEVRRPLREALIDVLIDHLMYTFGNSWTDEQFALPPENRHVVLRWWLSWCESAKKLAPTDHKQGQIFRFNQTGDMKELGTLAYDLYSLRLAGALDPAVLDDVRSYNEFQGARYEFAIAASLVRSGFDIKWIHKKADTHCEFEATHKLTKETIAVEVKSRHVPGTLNYHVEMPRPAEVRFIAHRKYNEALKQCPLDKPSAIFIDLNLPPEVDKGEYHIPWLTEMKQMLDKMPEPSPTEPAVETWLVFTNFAAHYVGDNQAPPQRHVFLPPQFARHPLKNIYTFAALIRAMETYGQIPMIE